MDISVWICHQVARVFLNHINDLRKHFIGLTCYFQILFDTIKFVLWNDGPILSKIHEIEGYALQCDYFVIDLC